MSKHRTSHCWAQSHKRKQHWARSLGQGNQRTRGKTHCRHSASGQSQCPWQSCEQKVLGAVKPLAVGHFMWNTTVGWGSFCSRTWVWWLEVQEGHAWALRTWPVLHGVWWVLSMAWKHAGSRSFLKSICICCDLICIFAVITFKKAQTILFPQYLTGSRERESWGYGLPWGQRCCPPSSLACPFILSFSCFHVEMEGAEITFPPSAWHGVVQMNTVSQHGNHPLCGNM